MVESHTIPGSNPYLSAYGVKPGHDRPVFTLAHLSDPHLAPLPRPRRGELIGKRVTGYINWRRKRRFLHDPAVLARIVADLKGQAPDHVAVTGDIANIALASEFPRGRDWLESLGAPADVSFVPGNHDIYVREAAAIALRQWGAPMSGDDGAVGFPYVRRRGPLALIGLSTGVPTAPFLATGWLGTRQLAALATLLHDLKAEGLFRVILIHHPPVSEAPRHKRLLDAAVLLRVIAEHGAELLLHGHDHRRMLNRLRGPDGGKVPAVGVPSASGAPGHGKDAAAYNLYRIEGAAGAWRCEMISRGIASAGEVAEQKRVMLIT
jgi:3',5'-cyclic AMP phosphodiesterase CpdA